MKRLAPSILIFGLFALIISAGTFWGTVANSGQSAVAHPQQQQQQQQQTKWEYARLLMNDGNAAWHAGEITAIIDVVSLEVLYQRLGGLQRANLTNLQNVIGRDGWELVDTDETVWTFKRPAR